MVYFFCSYIPKLTALDNALNQTQQLAELESILEQMSVLREEIAEKVERLDLNGSPLIKNLLDLVEKLKNKIEAKIEDLIYKRAENGLGDSKEDLHERDLRQEDLLNEQLALHERQTIERLMLKRPLNANSLDGIEFSIQKTPDANAYRPEHAAAIFKRQQSFDRPDTLQFTPPVLSALNDQTASRQVKASLTEATKAAPEADEQLDEVLRKLKT